MLFLETLASDTSSWAWRPPDEQQFLGRGLPPLSSPDLARPHTAAPPCPLAPGPQSHSLVQPVVEGQVEEPLGILGVRPPAGDAAGVVVMAAQGLQRDGP